MPSRLVALSTTDVNRFLYRHFARRRKVQAIQRVPDSSSFDEVFAADLAASEPTGADSAVPNGAGKGRWRVIRRGRTRLPDHGAVELAKAGAAKRRSTDR